MAPLRIAILECDKPLDEARIRIGAHTGAWRIVFEKAGTKDVAESPALTAYDVVDDQKYPALDSVDGILVSGSRYCAYGPEEWVSKLVDFVQRAVKQQIPVVGICFGHQIVARALGAEVSAGVHGWEVAPTKISLNAAGKALYAKDSITLHLMNKDTVKATPEHVEQVAFRDINPYHGMYQPKKVLTIQGHPEFTSEITGGLLKLRLDQGIIPQDKYEDAMKRLNDPTDGIVVGAAILKFYAGLV